MDSPFMSLGPMQEDRIRNLGQGDWDRDYHSFQELSERNERSRAMWNAIGKAVQFLRQASQRVAPRMSSGA